MKKSDEYRSSGYILDVHPKEFNQVSKGTGIDIFYVKNLHDQPLFLAELGIFYAEGWTREEAINKINYLLK